MELYDYSYDHAGRLTQTDYSLNNANPGTMAKYSYDDLGWVSSKTVNGNKWEMDIRITAEQANNKN